MKPKTFYKHLVPRLPLSPTHNHTMEKIKEKLHIGSSRRKSQPENDFASPSDTKHSTTFDSGPGHAAPTASHGRTGTAIEDTYGMYG